MLRHGIPGTRFTYKVADGVDFSDPGSECGVAISKPSVVICNHQSHIDLACQLIFTPNIIFLTNQWVWHNPIYGLIIRHAEFYPVANATPHSDRWSENGIDELMPKLRSLVERGYSIAVYPEGTRSRDCRIGRFHQGAFHIAEQLGLDVVPMYLYGPGRILPPRTYHLQKGPIYIEVGDPIPLSKLRQMGDTKKQASQLRKHYIEKYEQIANRIEQDV
jgi:1-acyl-sn-glycerol-3-phosphate acyltransferase